MHGSNPTIAPGSVHVHVLAPGPGTDPDRVAMRSRLDHHNHVAPRLTMRQAKALAIRAALGDLLGVRSLGSKLLRGERAPSKAHIRTLCERFRLNPAFFF